MPVCRLLPVFLAAFAVVFLVLRLEFDPAVNIETLVFV